MPITTPFNAPAAKRRPKVIKIRDGTDVAARYLVYRLYDATGGQPMQWHVLHGMGESAVPFPGRLSEAGSFLMRPSRRRKAALTGEGRRLARRGR
jgi:hypothetical protein